MNSCFLCKISIFRLFYFLLFFDAIFLNPSYGQNIGIGTSSPNVSAQLEIASNNKGVLIPRLDTAQINSISNPAQGLMVYCTTFKQLAFRKDTCWILGDGTSMNPLKLGDKFGGGIVVFLYPNRRSGLVAFPWAFDAFFRSPIGLTPPGTTVDDFPSMIAAGRSNTSILMTFVGDDLLAYLNYSLDGVYDDWYLPSKTELMFIYKAAQQGAFPYLYTERLWTSNPYPISNTNNGVSNNYWVLCTTSCGLPQFIPVSGGDGTIGSVFVRKF